MTTRQLSFQAPPSLALAVGATTPNPGVAGATAWSTTLGKLVAWNGTSWQLTTPAGSVALAQATVDFGATANWGKTFAIADAAATPASKVVMTPAPDSDEYDMDNFACAAYCAVAGTITAFIQALPGPVSGTRKFNYLLG